MNELEKFWRNYEEASELFGRLPAAYPKRRDIASLKARWEAGDKNVVKCDYPEEDGGTTYELQFTADQNASLLKAYHQARPRDERLSKFPDYIERLEHEARVFVGVIESWADGIWLFQSIEPDNQKARQRVFDSINNSFSKLDQALSELDSEALGYWYAHVVDALASSGIQLSPADNQLTSMVNHPLRAVVEGGEFRKQLRPIIEVITKATVAAKETLPKFNRIENDVRLTNAKQLERLIIEHGIAFDSSETGFPATCLRAIFDLAGIEVEKVSYWLKKAEDDPDSFARFRQRMADRVRGNG